LLDELYKASSEVNQLKLLSGQWSSDLVSMVI